MRLIRVMMGCVLTLASITAARAANITWGAATTIAGDTDVSTAGTLVAAYNIGNTGVAPATINGVLFAAFPIADGSTGAANGTLSVAGFGGTQTVATALNLGSASAPFSSLSANYQTMLGTGAVKSPFVQILDLNLSGLTVGKSYSIQLWTNDSALAAGSPAAPRLFSDFNGNFSGLVDANTTDVAGGIGQFIIGSFVADAATEFVSAHGNINPSGSDGAVLNGLQLRLTVPEPTSLGLFASGALFLLLARRAMRPTKRGVART